MFLQAQQAFGVSPERHYRLLHTAAEEKPRIIVLNVLVQAADNLEAKDANGKQLSSCNHRSECVSKYVYFTQKLLRIVMVERSQIEASNLLYFHNKITTTHNTLSMMLLHRIAQHMTRNVKL